MAFFPDLVRPSAGASDFVRSGAKPSLPRGPAPAASVFGVEGPGLGARRLRGPTVPAEGPLLDRLSVTTRCSLAKPALRGHLGRPFSPPGDPLGICAVSERLHEAMRGAPTGRSDSPFSQLPDPHPPATYPVWDAEMTLAAPCSQGAASQIWSGRNSLHLSEGLSQRSTLCDKVMCQFRGETTSSPRGRPGNPRGLRGRSGL